MTLTYISRLEGEATVGVYGYTKRLMFAALPARDTDALHWLVQPLYPEIVAASNVLETGLSNMNAVFHPPGMLMNAGWIEHTEGGFLFYREGITPAVGRVMEVLDDERLAVARRLGNELGVGFNELDSLSYDVLDALMMRRKKFFEKFKKG